MTRTLSTMLPLGTKAPSFRLPDPSGKWVSSDDFKGAPGDGGLHLQSLPLREAHPSQPRRVARLPAARSSRRRHQLNDVENLPADSPENMAEEIRNAGYRFPYLYDEARKWRGRTKPHARRTSFYSDRDGRWLSRTIRQQPSEPQSGAGDRRGLARRAGRRPRPQARLVRTTSSLGCNIKWKAGNSTRIRLLAPHRINHRYRAPSKAALGWKRL